MKNAYCDVQSTTMHTPLKSLRYYYNCWTYHSPDPWDLLVYLIKPHLLIFCNVSKWIKWGRLNWRKGGILQKVSRMTIRHQTPYCEGKSLIVQPNLHPPLHGWNIAKNGVKLHSINLYLQIHQQRRCVLKK